MRRLHWLTLTGLIIFLTACQTQPTALPEWVSNPSNQSNTLTAIGEGISLKEAQTNAKEALAAQLLSHVSNELTILTVADGAFQRTYTERLSNAQFKDIPLPATRFTQTTRLDSRYYTQISLDKQTLKNFLATRINHQINDNKSILHSIQNKPNAFERWWQYEQQRSTINQLTDQTLIYNSLFTPDNKRASKLITAFSQAYDQAKSQLNVTIHDRSHIKQLRDVLASQLHQHNIRSHQGRSSRNSAKITARTSSKVQTLQGDYNAISTLTLTLTSQTNQTMAQFKLTARGVSISSAHDAKQKSHRKLLDQLKRSDIIQRFKDA